VQEIETELAKLIGPLAKVLVKKAVPRTVSAQGLRDLLAVSIPDATAREAFVKPRTPARPCIPGRTALPARAPASAAAQPARFPCRCRARART
jgi:hypothetical protein